VAVEVVDVPLINLPSEPGVVLERGLDALVPEL